MDASERRTAETPVLFTDAEVSAALEPAPLAQALVRALQQPAQEYQVPTRLNLATGDHGVLVMPCRSSRYTGVKVSTWKREPGRAPRVVHAHYTLYDSTTGKALLAGDADVLTEMRTAAMSAIATDALALPKAKTLAVFGTGKLAAEHVRALRQVRPFTSLMVCGSSAAAGIAFASLMQDRYGIAARAAAPDACAAEADVICTCTTSAMPLFDGRVVRPGTHLNVLGSFHPSHREVDTATVRRARVIADNRAGALAEAGEMVQPIREGRIGPEHLLADLGEVLRGEVTVRQSAACITMYRGMGFALQDLVAAECLLAAFDSVS